MKNIRNFFALLPALSLLLTGCDGKEPLIDGRPEEPKGPQATLEIVDARLETGSELFMPAEDDAETADVSELATSLVVESNYPNWTVDVVTADAAWCRVFTSKDNNPETDDLALIELEPNDGLGSRSAVIRFSAGKGDLAITGDVTVTQFGYAPSLVVTPAESPINADVEGEIVEVTVAANIEWDYDMPELDWISDVTVLSRVATVNRVLRFEVEPNDELEERTATITLTTEAEDFDAPEIVIRQIGRAPTIVIDGDPALIEVTWDQARVDFDVTANIGYSVSMEGVNEGDPVPDWIKQAPAVRAFETKNLVFDLQNNGEIGPRSAVIVLKSTDAENPDVETRVRVEQAGNAVMTFVSQAPEMLDFEFDAIAEISIVVSTNVPLGDEALVVTVPAGVTRGTDTEDTEAGTMTLKFSTSQNTTGADRSGNITIAYPGVETITRTVSQKGEVKFMVQVPIMSADVDNKLSGGSTNPALYIDGDKNTFTDTNYNSTGFTMTTITLVSGIGASMERVVLFPRRLTSVDQMPKTLKFAYSTMDDPTAFVDVAGTFPVSNVGVTMEAGVAINFPKADNVHTLKVIATESYHAKFISLSEVEVFGLKGQNEEYMNASTTQDLTTLTPGSTVDFTIAANIEYDVTLPSGFTGEFLPSTRALPVLSSKIYRVTVSSTVDKSIGYGGEVVFESTNGAFRQSYTMALPGLYFGDNAANMTTTAKAKNASGELVDSAQNTGSEALVNMTDGVTDGTLIWGARYSSMPPIDATNPAILEFTFNDAPASVSMVRYWPRGSNGDFYLFKIFVKPVGGEYPATPNYERTTDARINVGPFDCTFDTVENPESVKIEVTKCQANYPSVKEMQFFQ